MMVSVCNEKGGSGKSTLAINIAIKNDSITRNELVNVARDLKIYTHALDTNPDFLKEALNLFKVVWIMKNKFEIEISERKEQ